MSITPAPRGTDGPGFRLVHPLPVAPDVVPTTAMHRLAGWWRQSHAGVCALVGIGGCGKTTAADTFLRATGVLAARAPAPGGRLAPAPAGAFLFSLAAAPPDVLFAEMLGWLAAPSSHVSDVLATLAGVARTRSEPLLVVIDALEQVQSIGGTEGVGRLTDARVRELLTRGAYGALPGVALLVTSRLALIDLEIQRLPLQTRIDMDAMDDAAAVATPSLSTWPRDTTSTTAACPAPAMPAAGSCARISS